METLTDTTIRDLHEFYVARINSLIEAQQESLVPALAAEYDALRAATVRSARAA